LIHIAIFTLRKNKASGAFVAKNAIFGFVACSFVQHFSTALVFCTSFVDKIVCNGVDTTPGH
jgi:mannitol-1-phosphate/altronate dehydrogenase